jgi:hypothetical protein
MTETKRISARFPVDLVEQIDSAAREQDRDFTKQLIHTLRNAMPDTDQPNQQRRSDSADLSTKVRKLERTVTDMSRCPDRSPARKPLGSKSPAPSIDEPGPKVRAP